MNGLLVKVLMLKRGLLSMTLCYHPYNQSFFDFDFCTGVKGNPWGWG